MFHMRKLVYNFDFNRAVGSSGSGWYVSGSFRCSSAFLICSSLSSTTTVFLLSALLMIMFLFSVKCVSACLSFFVRLSVLF